ncbi:MAG: phosphopantothenoylcysteine decarboxylase, partial [Candidatus Omnitrophica bacterium]|nr:phosphopantothenoylcysteine decarboxylase [Candidatus Omnitrophota bacterium]
MIKRILITAGPTIEPIDPVRYISNFSTGLMGYCLAAEAVKKGYKVVLISGPVNLRAPKGVRLEKVLTAADMLKSVLKHARTSGCIIMAAAVADFTPVRKSQKK